MAVPLRAQTSAGDDLCSRATALFAAFAERCEQYDALDAARVAWLEVLIEYDPSNEHAQQFLLATRDDERLPGGPRWTEDRRRDDKVATLWRRTATALAELHRRAAKRAGPDAGAARAAWLRVNRFAPADAEAGAALGFADFGGVFLPPERGRWLVRARALQSALDALRDASWPVEPVREGDVATALAGVGDLRALVTGMRGPRAQVFGDGDPAALADAVQAAERAELLCRYLLAEARDLQPLHRDRPPGFVFVSGRDDFVALVRASDESDADKEFVQRELSATWLRSRPSRIYVAHEPTVTGRVDWAARVSTSVTLDPEPFAMEEGAGHAVCTWLLDATWNWFAGPPPPTTDGTSADRLAATLLLPAAGAWHRQAIEQAWLGNGPPLRRLLELGPSDMSRAARVEAFAITRWLATTDPRAWRSFAGIDDLPAAEFVSDFAERTGTDLQALQQAAREHWRIDAAGLAPFLAAPLREARADRDVRAWLTRSSADRLRRSLPPLGFVAGLPPEFADVAGSAPLIAALGGDVDATTLADTDSDTFHACAARVLVFDADRLRERDVASACDLPGLRHLLLAAEVAPLHFATRGDRVLVVVPALPESIEPIEPCAWPPDGARDVPTSVPVDRLGKATIRWLGLPADQAVVGYPITLLLDGTGASLAASDASCVVRDGDRTIEGTLLTPRSDLPFRIAPPETLVFVSHAPLPSNRELDVEFHWRSGDHAPPPRTLRFRTR